MFHRRHMPIYLLVGWGVLDLALFLVPAGLAGRWWHEFWLLRWLLVWGQFLALSGWIAIGDCYIQGTFVGLFVLTALIGLGSASWLAILYLPLLAAQMLLYGVCLNLPLIIMAAKGRWLHFSVISMAEDRPAYQFSIREIMLYTVLVAGIAAAWGWSLRSTSVKDLPRQDELLALGSVIGLLAFPIPWSIWAAFGWARPLHSVLISLLIACFWGALCTRLLGDPIVMLYALLPSAVLIVHLSLLQVAGFRFAKDEPVTPAPPDRGPDWENAELWKKFGRPGTQQTSD